MNNKNQRSEILKILPKEIFIEKEVEIQIHGYYNEIRDTFDKGIVFKVYHPFTINYQKVLIEWDELESIYCYWGEDEKHLLKNGINDIIIQKLRLHNINCELDIIKD